MDSLKLQKERLALLENIEARLKDIESLEAKGLNSAVSRKKTEKEIYDLKEKIWKGSAQFSANELSLGKQIKDLEGSAFQTLNKRFKLEKTIITAKDVQTNGTKEQQKELELIASEIEAEAIQMRLDYEATGSEHSGSVVFVNQESPLLEDENVELGNTMVVNTTQRIKKYLENKKEDD